MFNTLNAIVQEGLEARRSAHEGYTNPPADYDRDDVRWAYESMLRAEYRLRAFGFKSFDVV